MKKLTLTLIYLFAYLHILPANANTFQNIDMVIAGGYNLPCIESNTTTTRLYVDNSRRNDHLFFVQVQHTIVNMPECDESLALDETYTKTFPMYRYQEVVGLLKSIKYWENLNPYIDGVAICDVPEVAIRMRKKNLLLKYNCGGENLFDAEIMTLDAELLLKSLMNETMKPL